MRCSVVRLPEPRLRLGVMHCALRSVKPGCPRRACGPEAEYGEDSYNRDRSERPDARQLHPVHFLSTVGYRAARSPLNHALRTFNSRCEGILSSSAGGTTLLAGFAAEGRGGWLFSRLLYQTAHPYSYSNPNRGNSPRTIRLPATTFGGVSFNIPVYTGFAPILKPGPGSVSYIGASASFL
jgi:hypothetical protein